MCRSAGGKEWAVGGNELLIMFVYNLHDLSTIVPLFPPRTGVKTIVHRSPDRDTFGDLETIPLVPRGLTLDACYVSHI